MVIVLTSRVISVAALLKLKVSKYLDWGWLKSIPKLRKPRVQTSVYSNERRATRRLSANCDAELVADLSILDSRSPLSFGKLIFLGHTSDISSAGIGLVLPSLLIDESYCDGDNRLTMLLRIPDKAVSLELNLVRCSPLSTDDRGKGYLLGARITNVLMYAEEFQRYLRVLEEQENPD